MTTFWSTVLDFGDPAQGDAATEPETGPIPDHVFEYCPQPLAELNAFRVTIIGDGAYSIQWPYDPSMTFVDSQSKDYTEIVELGGELEITPTYPASVVHSVTAQSHICLLADDGVISLAFDTGDGISANQKLGKIVLQQKYLGLVELSYSSRIQRWQNTGVSTPGPYYINVVYPAPQIVNGVVTGHKNVYTRYTIVVGAYGGSGVTGDHDFCSGLGGA